MDEIKVWSQSGKAVFLTGLRNQPVKFSGTPDGILSYDDERKRY